MHKKVIGIWLIISILFSLITPTVLAYEVTDLNKPVATEDNSVLKLTAENGYKVRVPVELSGGDATLMSYDSWWLDVWLSGTQLGTDSLTSVKIGDKVYLNYRLDIFDNDGNSLLPSEYQLNYTVSQYIFDRYDEVVTSNTFTNESCGSTAVEYDLSIKCGTQSGKVVLSGDISKTTTLEWELCDVPPEIITDLTDKEVTAGDSVTFAVEATGTNLAYSWGCRVNKKNLNLGSGPSNSYTIDRVTPFFNGAYFWCYVGNYPDNEVVSSNADLYVDWDYFSSYLPASNTADIPSGGSSRFFEFEPDYDGAYVFESSLKNSEICGRLYDESGNVLFETDGDGTENFKLKYWLDKYSIYYLEVWFADSLKTGQIPVTLSKIANPATYTIKYNLNGGTAEYIPDYVEKTEGAPVYIESEIPKKFPYSFLGWSTSAGSNSISYLPDDICFADENLSLHAVWKGPATLSNSFPVSAVAKVPSRYMSTIFRFTPQVSQRYVFRSETEYDETFAILYSSDGEELDYDEGSGTGDNFMLNPWLEAGETYYFEVGYTYFDSDTSGEIPVKLTDGYYTIKYDCTSNGGDDYDFKKQVDKGTDINLSYTAEKEDWEFVGWNTDPQATTPLTELKATGDTTLYAIFKKDYTLNFYCCDNQLQTTEIKTIYSDTTITLPALQEYPGWDAEGWCRYSDETEPDFYETMQIKYFYDDTINLYGIYSRDLTVSYNANGGSDTPETDVKTQYYNASGLLEEMSFRLPYGISRDGFTFSGWAKDSVTGEVYNERAWIDIKEPAVMYAVWKQNQPATAPKIAVSNILGGKSVTFSCDMSDATIYYTTNGSDPIENGTKYTGAISLKTAGDTTVKAVAIANGYGYSSVTEENISVLKADVPVASHTDEHITSPISVSLSCPLDGAIIYYTTNGTTPSVYSLKYTAPVTIDSTTTLKTIAVAPGYAVSECMVYNYTFEKPILRPYAETLDATNITTTTATLSGAVTDDGGDSNLTLEFVYWEKYNTAVRYTVAANGDFTVTLNNLAPSSTYFYYARVTNSAGSGAGEIKSFSTTSKDNPHTVTVSPGFISLGSGETCQLLASVLPATASNRNVVWSTSDKNVATVDKNGKIKAVGEGEAIITATTEIGRLKATCTVYVGGISLNGTFDFSEWNMATNTSSYAADGYDWCSVTGGGNFTIGTAYLARWDGAVLENEDKYQAYNGYPQSKYYEKEANYHVQEVLWLPERQSHSDNKEIKNALMTYGALYASFLVNYDYFSSDAKTYYYPENGSGSDGGHAITIVGWDDDYPKKNFVVTPPGNGAFICKNSWGESSGEGGYFYISYYDKYIGKRGGSAAVTSLEKNTNYNKIYQYDPLGAINAIGYDNTTYAANVFPEKGRGLANDEILRAVSFYTYHKNTSYEVYVVKNYGNSISLKQKGSAVASGTIKDMGYHTIQLKNPVELSAGSRFAVIVKLTVSGKKSYVYIEYPVANYSSRARAGEDESYISSNGTSWEDLTAGIQNANFCIKAFTDNGAASLSSELFSAIDNADREYKSDKVYTLEESIEMGMNINDDYIKFVNNEDNFAKLFGDDSGQSLGEVPSTAEFGDNSISFVEGSVLPKKYDLRTENAVTPVRNQGSWGTCWAHSMYGSLESNLLKKAKTIKKSGTGDMAGSDFITAINQSGIYPTKITLSEEAVILATNSSHRLYATLTPADATVTDLVWSSNNEAVATVDTNGQINTLKPGSATIICETPDGLVSAQCAVSVGNSESIKNIVLEYDTVTKSIRDVFMMDYSINPSTASNKAVTWSSDNPDVVHVNENGVMTALSVGVANITVKTVSGGKTDTVTIKVEDGLDCEITSLSANFQTFEQHVFGGVNLTVDNRLDSNKDYIIFIGIYDSNEKLISIKKAEETLTPGENRLSFNNLLLQNMAGKKYSIKCFVWNSQAGMQNVASVIEKHIE